MNSTDTATNQAIKSVAKEFVELDLKIQVQDVLLVPGLKVIFTATKCEVLDDDDDVIDMVTEDAGLYWLNQKADKSFLIADPSIWYKRLGHLNQQSMMKLSSMADEIVVKKDAVQNCVA